VGPTASQEKFYSSNVAKYVYTSYTDRKYFLRDLDVDGRIILKWILGLIWCGLNSYGLGQVPMVSCCDHDNEPSSTIKSWKFLN